MWLIIMLVGIGASYTLLKPYEEPDGRPVRGKSLKERLRNQILRL